ncbi:RES domain-containing protein [Neobacillus niacini]|uniref:RES domain-containing protein n=1 Tax=Neobacillus niacini TaxID=86668 RepID=UPI00203E5D89|nr:RES domain-containing protein [Neobacillus niacini]MCM3691501.1 RES domain-containing protein [Neobacillus niacini]
MNCCEKCFSDLYIVTKIVDNGEIGECNYCENEDVFIIPVDALTEYFERLFKHYGSTEPYEYFHPEIHPDPSEFGDSLINLINEDWNIFSFEIEGTGTDENMLFDILNADKMRDPLEYIDPHNLYSRITESFTFTHPLEGWEDIWERFKEELKHANRFFPSTQLTVFNNSFDDVLYNRTTYLAEGLTLYRARMGQQPIDKMMAPPSALAKAGRSNPHGISYLYCSIDEPTCVAEIRPWKGSKITVAQIELNKGLRVVNLLKGRLSPFLFDSPYKVLEVDKLLTYFSQELSTPVDPDKSEIEYLPTQFITELIKSKGFDGIMFKSAMGPQYNIVIFDEKNAEVKEIETLEVNNIIYEYDNE